MLNVSEAEHMLLMIAVNCYQLNIRRHNSYSDQQTYRGGGILPGPMIVFRATEL